MAKEETKNYVRSKIYTNGNHEVTALNTVEALDKMIDDSDNVEQQVATLGSKVGELESEIIGSETKTQLTPFRTHANYYISASGSFSLTQYWGGSTDVYKVQEGDIVEISGDTTAKGTDGRQINNTLWVTATAEGLNANYNKRLGTSITEETTVKERITIESGETFLKIANGINVIVQSISKGESLDDKLDAIKEDISDVKDKVSVMDERIEDVESVIKGSDVKVPISPLNTHNGYRITETGSFGQSQYWGGSVKVYSVQEGDILEISGTASANRTDGGIMSHLLWVTANEAGLNLSYNVRLGEKISSAEQEIRERVTIASGETFFKLTFSGDLVVNKITGGNSLDDRFNKKQDKLNASQLSVLNSGLTSDDVEQISAMRAELFEHEEIIAEHTSEPHPSLSGKYVVYVPIDFEEKTVYCDAFGNGNSVNITYCTADKQPQTSSKTLTTTDGALIISGKPVVQDVLVRLYATTSPFTSSSIVYEKEITKSLDERKQDKLSDEQIAVVRYTEIEKQFAWDACKFEQKITPVLGVDSDTVFAMAPDVHKCFSEVEKYHTLYYKHSDCFNKQCRLFVIAGDILFASPKKTISQVKTLLQTDYIKMLEALKETGISPVVALGGHDFNDVSSNDARDYVISNNLTKEEQRSLIIQPCIDRLALTMTAHISSDAKVCYYYIDDNANGTRYIFLDETDHVMTSSDGVRYDADLYGTVHYSNTQLNWLVSTLASTPSGKKVLVFNHTGVTDLSGVDGTREALMSIITAYVDRTTYSGSGSGWSVSANFTDSQGIFVGLFKGHTHKVSQRKINDKWWQICSSNAGSYASSNSRNHTQVLNGIIDGDVFHVDDKGYIHGFHYGRTGDYMSEEGHVNIASMSCDRGLDGSMKITE